MARTRAIRHYCKGCEAKGIATRVKAGQTLCPKCLEERLESPDSPGIPPVQYMKLKSQRDQTFQAVLYAVGFGIGTAFFADFFVGGAAQRYHQLRYPAHPYLSGTTHLLIGLVGAVVGAVIGWFVGLKRPPWRNDL